MTANPTRNLRKENQAASFNAVCLTCFASIGHPIAECGKLEHAKTHICDSAFLAERGILTRMAPSKGLAASHNRTSEAA